jgi:NAD(P)H-hydrate epimerase
LAGREGRDVIITPHPGEMARLVGMSADEVQASRLEVARNFAAAHRVYVVLKGHRTLIATPDARIFINPTGNPGMATGGTGDVLSGALGALLARGSGPWEAAGAGVYLHGAAGDDVAARLGPEGLLAADLADALPLALKRLRAGVGP